MSSNLLSRALVRRRLAVLTRLAIVAAAPVANTACDPAPDPYCSDKLGGDYASELSATAVWTADPDGDGYVITLTVTSTDGMVAADPNAVTSGRAILDDTGAPLTFPLLIRPDDGATAVVVTGSVTCGSWYAASFTATVDLSGEASEGASAPVTLVTE